MRTFAPKQNQAGQRTPSDSVNSSKVTRAAVHAAAPPAAGELLSSPGEPLDPAARHYLEPRFGHDFSRVRVHHDREAASAVRALGARAVTIGRDIAVAQYQPRSVEGLHLLAHELAHVVQQEPSIGHGAVMERAPASSELAAERAADLAMAGRPVPRQAPTPLSIARQVSASGRRAGPEMVGPFNRPGSAGDLIVRAMESAARDGHDEALRLFLSAFDLVQEALINQTANRMAHFRALDQTPAPPAGAAGAAPAPGAAAPPPRAPAGLSPGVAADPLTRYAETGLLDQLRAIVGYYPRLEREALQAGNTTLAAAHRQRGERLLASIRGHLRSNVAATIILEATGRQTPRGINWTIHGADAREEVVEHVPGTTIPSGMGPNNPLTLNPAALVATLAGQEAFITQLYRYPSVARLLGSRPRVDIHDAALRHAIWRAAYSDLAAADPQGAFRSLVQLLRQYLLAFTIHVEYSIRDTGRNYLHSQFPRTTTDQVIRDCGVYALTVAQELYEVGRSVQPPLRLNFQLHDAINHVMLSVHDAAANESFIFSNDQVLGPYPGADPRSHLSEAYQPGGAPAGQSRATDFVTPVVTVDAGNTGMNRRQFESGIWNQYRQAGHWSLVPVPATGAYAGLSAQQRLDIATQRYQQDMAIYQTLSTAVSNALIILERDSTRLPELLPEITRAASAIDLTIRRYITQPGGFVGPARGNERFFAQHVWGLTASAERQAGHPETNVLARLGRFLAAHDPGHSLLRTLHVLQLPGF